MPEIQLTRFLGCVLIRFPHLGVEFHAFASPNSQIISTPQTHSSSPCPVRRFLSAERVCVQRSRIRPHDSHFPYTASSLRREFASTDHVYAHTTVLRARSMRATSIEFHLNVSTLILSGHTQIAVFGPERHIQRRRHSGQLEYLAGPFIYRPSSLRFNFPTPLTPHTLCY